jgi:hypothetical protein
MNVALPITGLSLQVPVPAGVWTIWTIRSRAVLNRQTRNPQISHDSNSLFGIEEFKSSALV